MREQRTTLADDFSLSNGQPFIYHGKTIRREYVFDVQPSDSLRINFVSATSRPVQGIGITAIGCRVRVGEVVAKKMVLWRDNAPDAVRIDVESRSKSGSVIFVNQWRDEKHGTTLYHLNNSAMEALLRSDGSVLVSCSDGWGEPDFHDLVFTILRINSNDEAVP